jgi:hypothetical protein
MTLTISVFTYRSFRWYTAVLLLSVVSGLITIYLSNSTLPWWGFFVSFALAAISILFFGAQYAITGFNFNMQPVIQMIGGYMQGGNPVANMYFVLFGYNSVYQGQLLLKDLKFAQYAVGHYVDLIFNEFLLMRRSI